MYFARLNCLNLSCQRIMMMTHKDTERWMISVVLKGNKVIVIIILYILNEIIFTENNDI